MFAFFKTSVKRKYSVLFTAFSQNVVRMQSTSRPVLYGDDISPPVRFVAWTASLLGIEVDFHKIDLFKGENKSDYFKKINPLLKVPTLTLGDVSIRDSHAIALYFCRLVKNQQLYSTDDALTAAKVDELMFFNSSTLFPIDSKIYTEFIAGKWPADEDTLTKWYKALDYLDLQLKKQPWLAGDKMTLCDLACGETLLSMQLLNPLPARYVQLHKFLEKLKAAPHFSEVNEQGLKRMDEIVKNQKSILEK